MDDLAALLRAAAAGDRESFRGVVLATQGDVRLAIAARVPVPDLIEELLQRTYIAAWQSLPRYRDEGQPVAWLRGIARNQVMQELRARARRRQHGLGEVADWLVAEDDTGPDEDPRLDRLRLCLQGLGPQAQELLRRRYGDEHDLASLATAYSRTATVMAKQLQRLRDRLRRCVDGAPA